MGIKGLFSVLNNEPRRFGQPCITNRSKNVDIYIDAPGLQYHLIQLLSDANNDLTAINYPPLLFHQIQSSLNDIRSTKASSSTTGVISPYIIYHLTCAFCETLKDAIGQSSHIHLVFDGVASIHKHSQQLTRLKQASSVLDENTKRFTKRQDNNTSSQHDVRCNLPHLFGEDAMIAAVRNLQKTYPESFIIHYASWEAEGFIAKLIQKAENNSYIILSNDSDFLVFPSVQSLTPFHSLKYVMENHDKDEGSDKIDNEKLPIEHTTKWSLHGWKYTREKFMAAFSIGNQCNVSSSPFPCNLTIFTTIAALAGCDYTLPKIYERSLITARETIVRSDIGGLRQKDRNNPSARNTITAIIRYVVHFISRFKCIQHDHNLWLKKLVTKVGSTTTQRKKKIKLEKEEQILSKAINLIHDIYNDCCVDSELCVTEERLKKFEFMQELRRLLRYNILFFKPVMETWNYNQNDKNVSIWMESSMVQCRLRVYRLLKHPSGDSNQEYSDDTVVTEFCRANGPNHTVDYKDTKVVMTADSGIFNEFVSPESIFFLIEFVFLGYETSDLILEDESNKFYQPKYFEYFFSLLASFLLNDRDALVLLLLTLIPESMLLTREMKKVKENTHVIEQHGSYLESQNRIQLAIYHAKLGLQAIYCRCISLNIPDHSCLQTMLSTQKMFSPQILFRDGVTTAIWSTLIDTDSSYYDTVENEIISTVVQSLCSRLKLKGGNWEDNLKELWNIRLKCKK